MKTRCYGVPVNENGPKAGCRKLCAQLTVAQWMDFQCVSSVLDGVERGQLSLPQANNLLYSRMGVNLCDAIMGMAGFLEKGQIQEGAAKINKGIEAKFPKANHKFNNPQELANWVKKYVFGQDDTIDHISVPFFQHYRSFLKKETCPIKTPSLVIGPTGVGKTEMYSRFSELIGCPTIPVKISEMTPEDLKGNYISTCFYQKYAKGCSVKDLEYTVVIVDDLDTITSYGKCLASDTSSDFQVGIVKELMHLLDSETSFLISDPTGMNSIELPTKNMLIMFAGAFNGIEDIIRNRLGGEKSIGFSLEHNDNNDKSDDNDSCEKNLLSQLCYGDLLEYGIPHCLLNRLGGIYLLNPLSGEDIYQILNNAKDNVLAHHRDYCSKYGVDLRFTEGALRYISQCASKLGLGVRGAQKLVTISMHDIYYSICLYEPEQKKHMAVNVTAEYLYDIF